MAVLAWDETCSVHVRQLDDQHKKLFEIISSLDEAMRAGKSEDVIREAIHSLAVYTRTHFLQEEVLMKRTSYPGLAAHQAQHAHFMAEVERSKNDMDQGRQPDTVAMLAFLQKWLTEHVRVSDQAYSNHLNAHGVQ